jgi:regulator of cell morphogenesis and NO signaling
MHMTNQNTIGEIVAQDFRTAAVFEKYGIDFCCKGNKSLVEACHNKDIRPQDVLDELTAILAQDQKTIDFKSWSPVRLADYIEHTHHRYVEEQTPVLLRLLDKLCSVHGARHPELFEVRKEFIASSEELAKHMKKEELILFPRIRKMSKNIHESTPDEIPSGYARGPISIMLAEHDVEGERFRKIDALTGHYQPPEDACNTYKATYALLHAFENDLHLHIHLENNILFPMAIDMEKAVVSSCEL